MKRHSYIADKFIPCDVLYRAMGGYDVHGGRYDAAQRTLRANGWNYDLYADGWQKAMAARKPRLFYDIQRDECRPATPGEIARMEECEAELSAAIDAATKVLHGR